MSNVVKFYSANNPDDVLEQAIGNYDGVFIIGFDKQGILDARASLNLAKGEILFLIEQFKFNLVRGDYGE